METDRSHYHFVTEWTFDAPIDAVWEELSHPERWPKWWPGVTKVELIEPGDAAGLGAYRRFTFRSALPYKLRFKMRTTKLNRPQEMEGVADGELSGVGRWTLVSRGAETHVTYDWNIEATKAWMRWLAPIARPLFEWNHNVVMDWGREGLRQKLLQRTRSAAK